MATQLDAKSAPVDAADLLHGPPVPDEAGLLRQAVTTSAALRTAHEPRYILEILTSAARLVAPSAAVWAVRRIGPAATHASAFDTASDFGALCANAPVDPAEVLDQLDDRIAASQSPFEVAVAETPLRVLADRLPGTPTLTLFPMNAPGGHGALLALLPWDGLTAAQRSVLALLADEAAAALSLDSARSEARHAEALFDTLTRLSASFSERELVLQQIVRSAVDLLRTDAAWIMLADDEKKRLSITTAHGITSTSFFEASCGTDELLPGVAIRKRRVVCVGDLQGDPDAKYTTQEGLRSIFCAPMFVEDELLGVVIAANRETRDLEPGDRQIMGALASAAAISIANARLYAERESSIDRLAGVNALLEERSAALERTMRFQQRLTELVLAGAGLDELVRTAADALECRVLVLDRDLVVLHSSSAEADGIHVDAIVDAIRSSEDISAGGAVVRLSAGPDAQVLVAALDLAGERTAFVAVVDGEDSLHGADLGMTEAAVTAIGLELMRDRATAEAEARLTGGLFQSLLADDDVADATILRRASYLGYELAGQNVVIGVGFGAERGGDRTQPRLPLQSVIQRAVRRHWDAPTPVFERDDAVFVLLSDPEEVTQDHIKEQCRLVRQALELSGHTSGLRIAYSGAHSGVEGVRRAVGEATYALQVQEVMGKSGAPVAFDGLGVWTLLGRVGSREHLVSFAHSVLGELLAHDTERHAQLVDTLRALMKCNFHYRTAAEELYAHPNTIRYRMSRISALTGLDLADGDDRLKVELALRILDVVDRDRVTNTA